MRARLPLLLGCLATLATGCILIVDDQQGAGGSNTTSSSSGGATCSSEFTLAAVVLSPTAHVASLDTFGERLYVLQRDTVAPVEAWSVVSAGSEAPSLVFLLPQGTYTGLVMLGEATNPEAVVTFDDGKVLHLGGMNPLPSDSMLGPLLAPLRTNGGFHALSASQSRIYQFSVDAAGTVASQPAGTSPTSSVDSIQAERLGGDYFAALKTQEAVVIAQCGAACASTPVESNDLNDFAVGEEHYYLVSDGFVVALSRQAPHLEFATGISGVHQATQNGLIYFVQRNGAGGFDLVACCDDGALEHCSGQEIEGAQTYEPVRLLPGPGDGVTVHFQQDEKHLVFVATPTPGL